jgi:CheY-like chemotaxis protein
MFVQVSGTSRAAQGGLGIGLTLVKSLVELHGGSVEAASEGLGLGARFTVRLPLANSRPIGTRAAIAPRLESLDRQRILLVDDDRDSAESLGLLLRLLGAETTVTYSGPEALSIVERSKPTVIILDIGMPGMDGYEVARAIRAQPALSDVVLVALSGWGQDDDRAQSRAAGFDHHLVKPVEPDRLLEILAAWQKD